MCGCASISMVKSADIGVVGDVQNHCTVIQVYTEGSPHTEVTPLNQWWVLSMSKLGTLLASVGNHRYLKTTTSSLWLRSFIHSYCINWSPTTCQVHICITICDTSVSAAWGHLLSCLFRVFSILKSILCRKGRKSADSTSQALWN